jgi:hypothetical protein
MGLEISAQELIVGLISYPVPGAVSGKSFPSVPLDMEIHPINVFPLLLAIRS